MVKRKRNVRIVRGFGGWWIHRQCVHLLPEQRWIGGAYRTPAIAAYAARRRGYNVQAVERN